jgi:hypothetical protein
MCAAFSHHMHELHPLQSDKALAAYRQGHSKSESAPRVGAFKGSVGCILLLHDIAR